MDHVTKLPASPASTRVLFKIRIVLYARTLILKAKWTYYSKANSTTVKSSAKNAEKIVSTDSCRSTSRSAQHWLLSVRSLLIVTGLLFSMAYKALGSITTRHVNKFCACASNAAFTWSAPNVKRTLTIVLTISKTQSLSIKMHVERYLKNAAPRALWPQTRPIK